MSRNFRFIEINLLGIPPVKQPGSNEGDKNRQRKVRLRQRALNATRESDWPVDLYDRKMKLTILYNRGKAKVDSANIIGGIADALQGPCYNNDDQLVEIHYSEQVKSRKKYKSDRYQVNLEPIDIPLRHRSAKNQ